MICPHIRTAGYVSRETPPILQRTTPPCWQMAVLPLRTTTHASGSGDAGVLRSSRLGQYVSKVDHLWSPWQFNTVEFLCPWNPSDRFHDAQSTRESRNLGARISRRTLAIFLAFQSTWSPGLNQHQYLQLPHREAAVPMVGSGWAQLIGRTGPGAAPLPAGVSDQLK